MDLKLRAEDGYSLAATLIEPEQPRAAVLVSSATAVRRQYYRHFAEFLKEAGMTVLTYDYRGIGDSRPASLRGFGASMTDWAQLDMPAALNHLGALYPELPVFLVGHSFGGQVAGLLPDTSRVRAMLTTSSQSGYWKLQGGWQKLAVGVHMHFTFPLLARLMGYFPWSRLGGSQDLPGPAALEWSRWCRHPRYLLGDLSLPLHRYREFQAPVLAYSFADDNWGTAQAVDAMMSAYPRLQRRHFEPRQVGLESIGHFGFYRPPGRPLWEDALAWMELQLGVL